MGALVGVLVGLFAVLIWAVWACARSYIEVGRKRGIEQAVRELQKGIASHVELEGGKLPRDVQVALDRLQALLKDYPKRRSSGTDPLHAHLWVLGAALGEACWLKGHAVGVRRKAPAEGKLRIDFALTELLQLAGLANLGFQNMMPNARLFDMRRFRDEVDALDATQVISKIECAIPERHRPDVLLQAESRERLIGDWWHTGVRAIA